MAQYKLLARVETATRVGFS